MPDEPFKIHSKVINNQIQQFLKVQKAFVAISKPRINMNKLRWLFFFWLFSTLLFLETQAQQTPVVDTVFSLSSLQEEFNDLNHYLQIIEDTTNDLTIEDITSEDFKSRFVPYHQAVQNEDGKPQPLNPESAYWGKISIKNSLQIDKEWILFLGVANFAEAYFPKKDGGWFIRESGRLVPASEKAINLGRDCVIPLTISHIDEPITIYIRLKSLDHRSPFFQVHLQTRRKWDSDFLNRNLFQGIFQGILWILIFYHFATYLMVKDSPYLYYFGYMLVASIYYLSVNGFLTETIWQEIPVANEYTWITTNYSIIPLYFQFMRTFFNLKETLPRWDKILHSWLAFKILILLIFLTVVVVTFNIGTPNLIATTINIFDPIISLIFIISLLISKFKKKEALGSTLYVVIGASILNGFMIYNYLDVVLHYSAKNDTSMIQMGICFEILFFAIALGYREKEKEREKQAYQLQLINQLRENERLKSEANRILEQKVKERTAEIGKKNLLLEHQKEEIAASNEMLHNQKNALLQKNRELEQQQEEIVAQRDYIEHKNDELKSKNQKITDSIRYARTIQQAVLPTHQRLHQCLEDYFVIFRPKDIVSGDFYWMLKNEQYVFMAVADCTGHGVPGAFMSLISNTLLSETVRVNEIYEPHEILEILHQKVIIALRQREKANRDGMDILICRLEYLDKQDVSVAFSGAKRPLFYTQSDKPEIQELKGDNKSVGGVRRKPKPPFTKKTVKLQRGEILYLTTDGIIDQHAPNSCKFGTLRLKQVLSEYKNLPLTEQEKTYTEILDDHQQTSEQRDDITMMGIRL